MSLFKQFVLLDPKGKKVGFDKTILLTLIMVVAIGVPAWLLTPYIISQGTEFQKNMLYEIYGLIFDLFFIGTIVLSYNKWQEREQTIRRYREEIEDFLGWEEDEAKYRIVGNIKRLNRMKVTDINLRGAYLVEANLQWANLAGADLREANLKGSFLQSANLYGDHLSDAYLKLATLRAANLQETGLGNADLTKADLRGAHLGGADLHCANLEGADLRYAHLGGADLRDIIYDNKTNWEFIFYDDDTDFPLEFEMPETAINRGKLTDREFLEILETHLVELNKLATFDDPPKKAPYPYWTL